MLPHCPEMTERPTEHPFIGSELHSSARIAFITVASVEVVVGVFGNLLLINSMLSSQSFNISHVHNLFIANLALSDLIPLAYWMPFFILDLILGYHPVVNNTHCMVNGYIVGTCLGASVFSLLGISFNRYLNVCHYHFFKTFVTLPRTIMGCAGCWVLSLLLPLPVFFGAGRYGYNPNSHICSFDRNHGSKYPITVLLTISIVPMCVIGYWNLAIFRYWKRTRMPASARYAFHLREVVRRKKRGCCSACLGKPRPRDGDRNNANVISPTVSQTSPTVSQTSPNVSQTSTISCQTVDPPQDKPPLDTEPFCDREPPSLPTECERVLEESSGTRETAEYIKMAMSQKDSSKSLLNDANPASSFSRKITSFFPRVSRWEAQSITSQRASPRLLPWPRSGIESTTSTHVSLWHVEKRLKAQQYFRAERNFVLYLFIVIALLFASFMPFFVVNILNARMKLPFEVFIVANLFIFFNNAVNWIVYSVMNKSFRMYYLDLLQRTCPCCIAKVKATTSNEAEPELSFQKKSGSFYETSFTT